MELAEYTETIARRRQRMLDDIQRDIARHVKEFEHETGLSVRLSFNEQEVTTWGQPGRRYVYNADAQVTVA